MEYGLIGAKLGHSYSKIIHEMLCGYHYDLCPLPTEEEARAFLAKRQFKAAYTQYDERSEIARTVYHYGL